MHEEDVVRLAAVSTWLGTLWERLRRGERPEMWGWQPQNLRAAQEEMYALFPDARIQRPATERKLSDSLQDHHLYSTLLTRIHALAREEPWETHLWRAILMCSNFVPPDAVIEDFLAREKVLLELGHLPLKDAHLWRLAPVVDEALLTLALRRYCLPEYRPSDLEEVFFNFPAHEWMTGTLIRAEPSCMEKAELLLTYAAHLAPARREYHFQAAAPAIRELLQRRSASDR